MTYACCSGYWNWIHPGHIEYLERSKQLAEKLIVIVNNDEQQMLKYGKIFMNAQERMKIIEALRCVDIVILSIDTDRTVNKTLEYVHKKYNIDFLCNAGDQDKNCAESETAKRLGITLVDGLGDKIQSSSWLINAARQ